MKARIIFQSKWVLANRVFKRNKFYKILYIATNPTTFTKNYLLEDENGKSIIFYDKELILKPNK